MINEIHNHIVSHRLELALYMGGYMLVLLALIILGNWIYRNQK